MGSASMARWLFGLLLIAVGVLFLLDTTDVLDVDNMWGLVWPAILVFLGAWFLLRERGRSLVGLAVLLLGVGFFAQNAGWIEGGWIGRYWPVAVILAGLLVLAEALGVTRSRPRRMEGEVEVDVEDWLSASAIMAGRKERVRSNAWRGGDVTAVMGGVELDLRETTLASGGATLDATAVMGGIEIRVPEGWRVSMRGTPLLGGFDDKTGPGSKEGPVLQITGAALLGGVEVKH